MKAQENKRQQEDKKMENLIVLNTVAELIEFLDNTSLSTLVGRVAFASDLLDHVRASGYNQIAIDDELGFMDDGGWIEIDDMGYVVDDFAVN
jgi:hypothetical protein